MDGFYLAISFLVRVHEMYTKTGCTVDIYTPKGFIKILTDDVERQEGEACKNFGGFAEIERARGTTEAGAFGQRHFHAHIEYIYTQPHTIPPLPPFILQ